MNAPLPLAAPLAHFPPPAVRALDRARALLAEELALTREARKRLAQRVADLGGAGQAFELAEDEAALEAAVALAGAMQGGAR